MSIEQQVTRLVETHIVNRPDLFVVDVKMHGGRLLILVDGDRGVSVQDCAGISRYVGHQLEESNALETAYTLEVSSPGLDHPLLTNRQYQKNTGRRLLVKTRDGKASEGKLTAVSEAGIVLQQQVKEKGKKPQPVDAYFEFDTIAEAKVMVSFK